MFPKNLSETEVSLKVKCKNWFSHLQVAFIARGTIYEIFFLHELLCGFELRVTVYSTIYELLFTCELRVTVNYTGYELLFAYDLRDNFYMWVTSYFLIMSYNKDKDDRAVYDNKFMIKNDSLRSFFDKEVGVR